LRLACREEIRLTWPLSLARTFASSSEMLDWYARGELIKKEGERLESEIAEILN
jgi:hypothetical protein